MRSDIPTAAFDLSEDQRCSLTSYLNSAAVYFDEIAKNPEIARDPRLVEQFNRQAAEARRFATRIDNADTIRFGAEVMEPDQNDEVKCCPNCEKPNQFGEFCETCRREDALNEAEAIAYSDPRNQGLSIRS